MKVILLKDIAKLGKRGDVKEVAEGFGMNVLIRKGDAVIATPSELAKWKAKEEAKLHKKELATSTFAVLVDALRATTVTVSGKKHDEKGQLFAAVKEVDIVDAIFQATKYSVDPKQVILTSPIKSIGKHVFDLKQGERKEKVEIVVK